MSIKFPYDPLVLEEIEMKNVGELDSYMAELEKRVKVPAFAFLTKRSRAFGGFKKVIDNRSYCQLNNPYNEQEAA